MKTIKAKTATLTELAIWTHDWVEKIGETKCGDMDFGRAQMLAVLMSAVTYLAKEQSAVSVTYKVEGFADEMVVRLPDRSIDYTSPLALPLVKAEVEFRVEEKS